MDDHPAALREAFLGAARDAARWGQLGGLGEALASVVSAAEGAWPGVRLPPAAFVAQLARSWPDSAAPEPGLSALHTGDLYLACACALGSAPALRCFEQRCLAGVPRALAHLRLGPADIDEVLQELRRKLFVAVAPARPKIRDYAGRGTLAVWVRAAAVRTALNLLAQPGRRERPLDEALLDRAGGPLRGQSPELLFVKQRDRRSVQAGLRAVLARLEATQRTLLRLHYLDGLSLGEIGTLQRVHKATICRRLRQIEEHIAGGLREELGVTLRLPAAEAEGLIQLVLSQLDQSLAGLLADPQV